MKYYKLRNNECLYWKGIMNIQTMPTIYNMFDIEGKLYDDKSILLFDIERTFDQYKKHSNFLYDCEIIEFELIEIKKIPIK